MSSPTQATAPRPNTLQEWQPLLELASKEVFEITLGCKLEAGGVPVDGVGNQAGHRPNFLEMISGSGAGLYGCRSSYDLFGIDGVAHAGRGNPAGR